MKWTNAKLVSRLALLGLVGTFAPAALAATEINCQPKPGLNPQITNPDQNCAAGESAREPCRRTHELVREKYNEYITTLNTKCQEANQQLKSIGTIQQKNAQGKTKEISAGAASAMEALVQEGKKIQREVMQAAKRNNYDPLVALPATEGHPSARSWASRFATAEAFSSGVLQAQATPGKPKANAHIAAIKKANEFANKLGADIAEREGSAGKLKTMSETAGQNEQNGGAEKDEKSGKGMDPSALAGPLAGLAGMAGQQANKGNSSDTSSLSDPLASQNSATSTTPETVTPAPATVKSANVATNKAGATTDSSKTGSTGKNGAGFENSPNGGSGLSAGSVSGPYADAFTGVGPNGTSSSFGGATGTSGFGGGAGGASSTGASSSPGSADAAAAEEGMNGSHSEDEALAAFGGGGLNFSGGASSSGSSSSSTEEPVKDFLEDAATSFDGTEFGEENGELDGNLESAGVQGEDGTELFRRVRSALERSQRKGAVMSGLGAGHKTR